MCRDCQSGQINKASSNYNSTFVTQDHFGEPAKVKNNALKVLSNEMEARNRIRSRMQDFFAGLIMGIESEDFKSATPADKHEFKVKFQAIVDAI